MGAVPDSGRGMYEAMKRHEVQVLKQAGVTLGKITEATGVSRRSVQRIALEPPVEGESDAKLARARRVGRPSKAEPFRKQIEDVLAAEPELPTVEVLHRARQAGYTGGKSAFYRVVAELLPNPTQPMVRFEGLAGEFSQHDCELSCQVTPEFSSFLTPWGEETPTGRIFPQTGDPSQFEGDDRPIPHPNSLFAWGA